jgi:hypothetical protein
VEGSPANDSIRVAELMAALSLATDLGLGQPLEHELGVCLAALELADRLGCTAEERSEVYYVALLIHVGCTAAAPYFASWVRGDEIHFQRGASATGPASEPREDMKYLVSRFADDRPLPERARLIAKMLATGEKRFEQAAASLCEGGRLLARRLHLPEEVAAFRVEPADQSPEALRGTLPRACQGPSDARGTGASTLEVIRVSMRTNRIAVPQCGMRVRVAGVSRGGATGLASSHRASSELRRQMSPRVRTRFWIETALATLTTSLFLLTIVTREWIEVVFGVDPDGGDGSLEWAIVGVLLASSVMFSLMARAEWRRQETAAD